MGVLEAGLSPRAVTAYTVMVYSVAGFRLVTWAVDWVPGTVNSLMLPRSPAEGKGGRGQTQKVSHPTPEIIEKKP